MNEYLSINKFKIRLQHGINAELIAENLKQGDPLEGLFPLQDFSTLIINFIDAAVFVDGQHTAVY